MNENGVAQWHVRLATIADAPALTRLATVTFRETFEGENTPEDMARYVAEAFTPERQAAEIADPGGTVLVAESRGALGGVDLVGYAHLVSTPPPAAVQGPSPLELKRLYVARARHGRGVAQALMDAAFAAARARGAQTLWLGVWERNARAVAFYAKYGFTRVGEHTFLLGGDAQTDWLLSRPLETRTAGAPAQAGIEVNRGDLFWVAPDDSHGSVSASHPHVVVQEDVFNRSRITTVIVCALTTNLGKANEPGNVLLEVGEGNLPKQSVVVVSQISSIEKSRLGERIGALSQERVDQILAGLLFQQASFFRR